MLARPDWQPEAACESAAQVARLELLVRQRLGPGGRMVRLVEGNGALVIRGQVRTYHDKQIAQQFLMMQPGVRRLINELEVV